MWNENTGDSAYHRMLAGDEQLNMTLLALNLSRHVNGMAREHVEAKNGIKKTCTK